MKLNQIKSNQIKLNYIKIKLNKNKISSFLFGMLLTAQLRRVRPTTFLQLSLLNRDMVFFCIFFVFGQVKKVIYLRAICWRPAWLSSVASVSASSSSGCRWKDQAQTAEEAPDDGVGWCDSHAPASSSVPSSILTHADEDDGRCGSSFKYLSISKQFCQWQK